MRLPFFIPSAMDGTPLSGVAATVTLFGRTNLDGSFDDLSESAPAVLNPDAGPAYSVEVDDALFTEPGCSIDLLVDCTAAAAPRYIERHLTSRAAAVTELEASGGEKADLELKREDLTPAFEKTLRDPEGNVVDLTDKKVTFRMRQVGADVLKVNAEADIVDPAKKGRVRYEWQTGDTTLAGVFDVECYVEDADDAETPTGPRTVPASFFFRVEIFNSLADT